MNVEIEEWKDETELDKPFRRSTRSGKQRNSAMHSVSSRSNLSDSSYSNSKFFERLHS